ncbi:MAG: replicative DNA helicase [Alistipes sp.]|nr:replicative DNA helicase [Alistipes sp.]
MAREFTPSARNRAAYDNITEANVVGTVPPQAIELEEAVLGALMLEHDSIIAVQEYVTADAFYTEEHRLIYKAIESLSAELKPIDLYTVTECLKVRGELKKVGGAAYLAQLTQKVGSAANVEFHAKIIAQKYVQRELIRSATEIQRRSYDEDQDVTDLIGYAESEIFKVAEGHVKRSVQSAKDVLAKAMSQIEEASKNTSAFNGVPSGFMAVDRVTLGWQPSDLIIIAARPAMGKTAFVLSMARNMAIDHESPVAFFSLEMSSVQLMMRLIIAETGLSGTDIKSGRLTPEQWRHLESATKPLGTAPLFIDDTPALSVFEFRSKARRLKIHNDIKIIIIDYLQLMTGNAESKGNREQEVAFISRTLKAIAKELNVPIIALSQLSRATETRGGSKRPQLSDLRESGAIEQDADIVAFIHRPEYYGMNTDENGMPTAGMAEIIIAKHRSGAATDVKLRFLKEQTRFMDLDMDEFSTAGDPMGGGYTQIASSMGGLGDDEFALPVAGGASAPMGGLGAPMGGGLGSSMGGNEFDIQQGPTNMDKQRPLTDEVPF